MALDPPFDFQPLDLWPAVVRRIAVPADVEAILVNERAA
ncbi:hypothetical protein J2S22_000032 [Rhodoplanes tepidamans]|nr:hypothetical protein [Rhodoplanes tepidamans]